MKQSRPYTIFLPLLLSLTAACSSDEPQADFSSGKTICLSVVEQQPEEVTVGTRGVVSVGGELEVEEEVEVAEVQPVTRATLRNMNIGVWAYENNGGTSVELLASDKRTYDNNSHYDTGVAWPTDNGDGNSLKFWAYSPYWGLTIAGTPSYSAAPAVTVTEVENGYSNDILFAATADGDYLSGDDNWQEVNLTFRHILSLVRFKKGDWHHGRQIQSISIGGMAQQATFDGTSWTPNGSTITKQYALNSNNFNYNSSYSEDRMTIPQSLSGKTLTVTYSDATTATATLNTTLEAGRRYLFTLSGKRPTPNVAVGDPLYSWSGSQTGSYTLTVTKPIEEAERFVASLSAATSRIYVKMDVQAGNAYNLYNNKVRFVDNWYDGNEETDWELTFNLTDDNIRNFKELLNNQTGNVELLKFEFNDKVTLKEFKIIR